MDRDVIIGMVEDYWRIVIPAMQTGGADAFADVSSRFEERIKQTAALLPPVEAAAFSQTIDAEREKLIQEYQANPVALKKRLGIDLGRDASEVHKTSGRQGLGELAVRTAVRATVWESIWALFRAAR